MKISQPLLLLLLLATTRPAVTGSAYTWTDSTGVTHFSESAPPDVAQPARRVDLQPAPVIPGPPPERYRAISDQAARLEAARIRREQAREKQRQLEEKRQARAYAEDAALDENGTLYVYPYTYWHRPRPRHHHHPRPPHPDYRHGPHSEWPPRSGRTITQKRNAESLRDRYWHW